MLGRINRFAKAQINKLPDSLVEFNKRYIGFRAFLGIFILSMVFETIFLKELFFADDYMLISGFLTFTFSIAYLSSPPATINEVLQRLQDRKVITVDDDLFEDITSTLASRTAGLSFLFGLLIAIIMFISFRRTTTLHWCLIFAFGGYVVGSYFGAMVADGLLGSLLKEKRVELNVMPGHIDNAGGLKPVGDYYFFHAKALAIPAAFFAVWVMIMTFGIDNSRYEPNWLDIYSWLLVISIAIEFLAFLLPMWTFHRAMQSKKKQLFARSDRVGHEIIVLKTSLTQDLENPKEQRDHKIKQIELLTERYAALEKLPTWPIDPTLSRKFTVANLVLFIPYLIQLLKDFGFLATA